MALKLQSKKVPFRHIIIKMKRYREFMNCREKSLSNNFYDIIMDYAVTQENTDSYDFCYANIENLYNIVYVSRSGIPSIEEYFFDYNTIPKLYGLMQEETEQGMGEGRPGQDLTQPPRTVGSGQDFDPTGLIASGITQVQREPLGLNGQGVVIACIDTGIDYRNPAFWDENGESRILAIWDQTIQEGAPPEGFSFGTEYTREEINRALASDNPYEIVPSRDENGHGSAMAAVAAGSSRFREASGTAYTGAAPRAEIVVVKLKECKPYLRDFYLVPEGTPAYQENDIMLGVQYADRFAIQFRRPVVICLGVGTNFGDHGGNSPLARYLNWIAVKRSRAVVVCGGNEGNAAHHYRGLLEKRTNASESSANVEIRVGENANGFFLEMWGNVPDAFNVTIRSPGGETIPPIRLGIPQSITYGFIYERTRITIDSVLVEPASGEELIVFRVQNPTPGIWNFRVESVGEVHNGVFHMWLPITAFLNTQVYFLESTPYTTLTEPAMAADVISVSAYDASNNSFYAESGRGFSRIGSIRPDLASPGVNVSTIFGKQTGSSLSAAITAGAVAQFMQWAVVEGGNKLVESREIKSYLIRGASRSSDLTYPNREWGYGRLNMVGTFEALIRV